MSIAFARRMDRCKRVRLAEGPMPNRSARGGDFDPDRLDLRQLLRFVCYDGAVGIESLWTCGKNGVHSRSG